MPRNRVLVYFISHGVVPMAKIMSWWCWKSLAGPHISAHGGFCMYQKSYVGIRLDYYFATNPQKPLLLAVRTRKWFFPFRESVHLNYCPLDGLEGLCLIVRLCGTKEQFQLLPQRAGHLAKFSVANHASLIHNSKNTLTSPSLEVEAKNQHTRYPLMFDHVVMKCRQTTIQQLWQRIK